MPHPHLSKFLQSTIFPDGMTEEFLEKYATNLYREIEGLGFVEGQPLEKKDEILLSYVLFRGRLFKLPLALSHVNERHFDWPEEAASLIKAYFADR